MLCADRKVGATFDSEASASAQPKPTTLPTSQNLLHVCSWSSKAGPVVHMWLSESAESLASFSFPLLKVRLVLTPQPTHPPTSPLSKFAPRLFPVKKEWSTSDYKSRICSEHLIPTFDNGDPARIGLLSNFGPDLIRKWAATVLLPGQINLHVQWQWQ